MQNAAQIVAAVILALVTYPWDTAAQDGRDSTPDPGLASETDPADGVGAEDYGDLDFLVYEGTIYFQSGCSFCAENGIARDVAAPDLGAIFARVEQGVDGSENPCSERPPPDRPGLAASLLPVGTEVWEVNGYDPRVRLVVVDAIGVRVFEAFCGRAVQRGADLFDFSTLVRIELRVGRINAEESLLAVESNPDEVTRLAQLVADAPVAYQRISVPICGHAPWAVFVFADGTATARRYHPPTGSRDQPAGLLDFGILVPDAFQQWVERGLELEATPAASGLAIC